jgi:hypothetical protein
MSRPLAACRTGRYSAVHQRLPPNELTYHQHVPGFLLVDDKFVADALRQLATDASSLASHALGASTQPLELLVEVVRITPVLERGGHTAVHNCSRDSRDGEGE